MVSLVVKVTLSPVSAVILMKYEIISPFCSEATGGSQDSCKDVSSTFDGIIFCGGPVGAAYKYTFLKIYYAHTEQLCYTPAVNVVISNGVEYGPAETVTAATEHK